MFKKFLSFVSVFALAFGVMPTAFAADVIISSFIVSHNPYDPAPNSSDGDLELSYSLDVDPDSAEVKIVDAYGDQVFNDVSGAQTDILEWDGIFGLKLVEPGNYTATLTAIKSGYTTATQSKNFSVAYNHSNKPGISAFTLSESAFDPDFDDVEISFINTRDADLTVEIRNSVNDVYKTFTDYTDDNFDSGEEHTLFWDGRNNSGQKVSLGDYLVVVTARSDYGVTMEKKTVSVLSDDDGLSGSNSHIKNIDLDPSSKFQPSEDEDLVITFDIEVDLDELTVVAKRGSEVVELEHETDVESENNYEVVWDAQDEDGDYVAAGTWRIEIESNVGSQTLKAGKSIEIEYDKPAIRDLILSKDEFDPDQNESTYIIFWVDSDTEVDINILEDGDVDDTFVEDMDVEKDRWYAVEWDGDNYDENDDVDIEVVAKNISNDDVNDKEKADVDLKEDEVASSKSNVTEDYISPAIAEKGEGMTIYYNLEDEATVTVSIYDGENGNGSAIKELVKDQNQDAGDHFISWNGRDKDGDPLDDDQTYSYKIVSKKTNTDSEVGAFVVGTVGDIDGAAIGDDDDDDDDDDGNTGGGVIVDGNEDDCDGFSDVDADYEYCAAIEWAQSEGIFEGYSDGKFRPNQSINRAEAIKVILEAFGVSTSGFDGSDLDFVDVNKNAWYAKYLAAALDYGIFEGDENGKTARPNASVNRAEAMKMATVTSGLPELFNCEGNLYVDVDEDAWYAKYICVEKSYFGGLFKIQNNRFKPNEAVSRGEMANMLYEMLKDDTYSDN